MKSNSVIKDYYKYETIRKFEPGYLKFKINTLLREAGVWDVTMYLKSHKFVFHINGKNWSIIIENPGSFWHIYDETEQQLLEYGKRTQRIRTILDYLLSIIVEIEFCVDYFSNNIDFEVREK